MIDYQNALREFQKFLSHYDVNDGKIHLKIVHTYKVAELSGKIARGLHLNEEEVQLAELIGLLHDIGRFEQIRLYNTFVDGKSVDHAALGVQILKKDHFISHFCSEKYQPVILSAVANHNRFKIENGLDKETLMQCRIIRDADKTDIFRVRIEDPLEDAMPCSLAELENGIISENVFDSFMNEKEISKKEIHTYLDIWVMGLAFIYDYNYPEALALLEENDYINRQIDRLDYHRPETAEKMERIREKCHVYIHEKIKEGEIL